MRRFKPLFRYLLTVPLFDALIWLLIWQDWNDELKAALWPLYIGGLFLSGMICGAAWIGRGNVRRRTVLAYTLFTLFVFPFPPHLFYMPDEPSIFWLLFFILNVQQTVGFAVGAVFRISWQNP